MKRITALLTLLAASNVSWGSIIFDDFNTSAGHFGYTPTFSSTTSGLDAVNSSSLYDTTAGDPFEGAGAMKLTLTHSATAGTSRVRWLSGGPPYDSSHGGVPSANVSFNVTGTGDGNIGLYVKTDSSGSGWNVSFNLDSGANTGATMSWSGEQSVIADGQWHLYEWTIDSTTWAAVPGIGGQASGSITTGSRTIDSIYFRDNNTVPAGAVATIFVDFVAKSDSGSIATLVPEPSALALGLLGGVALFARHLRRR
ncbi:MAG TPA: hypothetical protein VN578_20180 [Candidatus Binatia bacterium]|jgi:hypothetical protein|nr:hypothetical protein [Candidatus Binatia bacterium]